MKISIDVNEVFDLMQDQLGMIGKRVKTQNGEPTYSSVALSSREMPVVLQFVREAVTAIFALAPERMADYNEKNKTFSFSVNSGRDNDDLSRNFTDLCRNYVLNYSIAQYLAMATPELAKKYFEQTSVTLSSLRGCLFSKSAMLTSSDALTETKGVVEYSN